jgi:hypothetical protein
MLRPSSDAGHSKQLACGLGCAFAMGTNGRAEKMAAQAATVKRMTTAGWLVLIQRSDVLE